MKLTRKLVLSRAKASDLVSVKKLNCWGCNLTDISIFTEIPNVEVLTLSANNISSLEHLSNCYNLSELYLRRNDIQSLSELCHLQNLTCLKVLWLAENPCCGTDHVKYRLTVLRNLPGLQKLDNQAVSGWDISENKCPVLQWSVSIKRAKVTVMGGHDFLMYVGSEGGPISQLAASGVHVLTVVTEEELALALEDREEVITPPGPATASSTNGITDADSEYDPLNYSMDKTNKMSAQLGMKSLARDKISSSREAAVSLKKKSHTLEAVLLLLKDLDMEELKTVQCVTENKLRARSRQKEKISVAQR